MAGNKNFFIKVLIFLLFFEAFPYISIETLFAILTQEKQVLPSVNITGLKEDEEATKLKMAINSNPKDLKAYESLGVLYIKMKKFVEAAETLKNAIKVNPKSALYHDTLGSIYGMDGKLDEAIKEFSKAIKINPNFAQAHKNLGKAYILKGEI